MAHRPPPRALKALPVAADGEVTEHHTLVEVARLAPRGIICLLSALRFHGLGTQLPPDVWLAIPLKGWRPTIRDLPVRFVYMSGPAFEAGVETHVLEGVTVRITNAAKTVADCFKFRNKVGLDVALDALRDYRGARRDLEELRRFAKVCRVDRVMRPYLEALAS
jgi:predicted transcriptional regulator of viral defense system